MTDSRELDDLHPEVFFRAKAFLEAARSAGIDLLVTSTFRSADLQDKLFAQGRTAPGNIVTQKRGGESFHNWRCALDVVPMKRGKVQWGSRSPAEKALWEQIGTIGESCGLAWSGRWKGKFRELAHFQYTGGLTLAELQAGKIPQ